MNEEQRNTVIGIDVTLEVNDERVLFLYQGADETSRKHVDKRGNIDLSKPDDLGVGPVDLCFRLQTSQLSFEGVPHQPGFALRDSIWITEAARGSPTGPYRGRGFLVWCGLRRAQFYGYSNQESETTNLRFTNRNNDGKEYKYTLRVCAVGAPGERWLEDDPKIKNRGGHMF